MVTWRGLDAVPGKKLLAENPQPKPQQPVASCQPSSSQQLRCQRWRSGMTPRHSRRVRRKIGGFRVANVVSGDNHMMTSAMVTVLWLSVRDHDPQRPAAYWQGWQPCWDATCLGSMMINLGIEAHRCSGFLQTNFACKLLQKFGPSQRLGAGSWGKMSCPTPTCFLPNPEFQGWDWDQRHSSSSCHLNTRGSGLNCLGTNNCKRCWLLVWRFLKFLTHKLMIHDSRSESITCVLCCTLL